MEDTSSKTKKLFVAALLFCIISQSTAMKVPSITVATGIEMETSSQHESTNDILSGLQLRPRSQNSPLGKKGNPKLGHTAPELLRNHRKRVSLSNKAKAAVKGTETKADTGTETETLSQDYSNYTESFEVLKPVSVPAKDGNGAPCQLDLMTNHLFANSPPPFVTEFTPPAACGLSWSLVTLKWSANVIGVQYDRLAAVFFDDLQVLRTTTEEPSAIGVKWNFETDITRFAAFLKVNRTVSIDMGNVVDSTYTGVYNVSVSVVFYPGDTPARYADVIIPLGTVSDDGFCLTQESNVGDTLLTDVPRNAYRAVLEVTQCQSADDEFYWANVPTEEYVDKLPEEYQSSFIGGGVFRETLAYVDGLLVGSTWQYPVIYTGGVNPYWWRPVVGIGAFVVPTYFVDATPAVGLLVGEGNHTVGLAVEGVTAGGAWYVAGALHLWLDKGSEETSGKLLVHEIAPSVTPSISVEFLGILDANITTKANRVSKIIGYISTSFGNFTATVTSEKSLYNNNQILENGDVEIVEHSVKVMNGAVMVLDNGTTLYRIEESYKFPLFVFLQVSVDEDEINYSEFGSFKHAFNFNKTTQYGESDSLVESQFNLQRGGGVYSSAAPGFGFSSGVFSYANSDNECYSRVYQHRNLVFAFDNSSTVCGISL